MTRQQQIRRSDSADARRVQAELDAYAAERRAWRKGDRERAGRLAKRSAAIIDRLEETEI